MRLAQMLIVCESYLYSLQIRVQIWYNTSIKTAIKCDIRCKIKPCNCRLLLRMTYYAPVAKLAYFGSQLYCLTKRVQICRGRLTVGQRIANPSSGQSPACEFESRSLRHMLMWPSGRWQRSRKPPVRNRPKVRILP